MTVLQALDTYYDRMAARGEADQFGFSREKIAFAVVLSEDGEVVDRMDLRDHSGKRPQPSLQSVPAAVKRTVGIQPNLFWDKTAYALGRTAGEGRRTASEHEAFRKTHLDLLAGSADAGMVALRRFLEAWSPKQFDQSPFTPEMLDSNIVFRLDGEQKFLHERAAAQALLGARSGGNAAISFCLVTGARLPTSRLHPTIKGVEDAQSSGASLVSFNRDAFTSYGKQQGDNAPTSELAAFRYGTALNRLLDRGSRNRLPRPIGDTTIVFWADASGVGEEAAARLAEDAFAAGLGLGREDGDDAEEAAKLHLVLENLAKGRPARNADVEVTPGTRFHILGLSPNAARLSVRFWLSDNLGAFARRFSDHFDDLQINPAPWRTPPAIQRLLVKTVALQEKFENIPPLLAGELTRAVLGGWRYPRTLITAAITRLRAGDDPNSGWHAAAIRACLARDHRLGFEREDVPVALDKDNPNQAYQLGRLFAVLEIAQRMALGKVNASIRDRYYGAASATPASVFPLLLRGAQNHLGKLRKDFKGGWLEREIEAITDHLPPELPRSLRLEAQGRFAIGYYHQRRAQFAGRQDENDNQEETPDGDE